MTTWDGPSTRNHPSATEQSWDKPAAPKAQKETVTVRGVLQWANLSRPNEDGKYSVDITELSDPAVNAINEKLVIKARYRDDKPEKGFFLTAKSSRPIKAYDNNGNEIDEGVGNGSVAEVRLSYYDWKTTTKAGRSPSIVRLKITNLVPYGDSSYSEADEEVF